MTTRKSSKSSKPDSPPAWEWVLAALGAAMILTALATTLYRAATQEDTPAAFEIEVVSTASRGDSYGVNCKIKNVGSHTAAAVTLEGTLTKNGEEIESSAAAITYIPPQSEREATVFFSKNPAEFEMKIRVTGYERP